MVYPITDTASSCSNYLYDVIDRLFLLFQNKFWVFLLPSLLSLVYAILVQVFLAIWGECSWFHMQKVIRTKLFFFIVTFFIAKRKIIGDYIIWNDFSENVFPIIIYPLILAVSYFGINKTYDNHVVGTRVIPSNKDALKDVVVLITGANSGIGKETARQLLEFGATVIFACRSEQRAERAMKSIIESSSCDMKESKLIFLPLDLSDLESVRRAVKIFETKDLPLHILINNAGIMMNDFIESKQGYELVMQCNHLGHFLLTLLLLPHLKKQNNPRVINISSSTYTFASPGIQLHDLMCRKRKYTLFGQYSQSKLANILFTRELSKREPHVTSVVVHPGLVRTNVTRNMSFLLRLGNSLFGFVLKIFQKTPEAGAYTSVYCTFSDQVKSGCYYVNSEEAELLPFAKSAFDSAHLWKLSEELVGIHHRTSCMRPSWI